MRIFKDGLQDHMMLYFPEHDPPMFEECSDMLAAIDSHSKLLYRQSLAISETFDKLFFVNRKADLKTRIGIMNQSIKSFQTASRNMVKQTSKCSKNQQKNNPNALLEYINESEMLFENQKKEIITKIQGFKTNERNIWNQRLSRVLHSFYNIQDDVYSAPELLKNSTQDIHEKPVSNLDYDTLQAKIDRVRQKSSLAKSNFAATSRNTTLRKNRSAVQFYQSQQMDTSMVVKNEPEFTSISETTPSIRRVENQAEISKNMLSTRMKELHMNLDDFDSAEASVKITPKRALTLKRGFLNPRESSTKREFSTKKNPIQTRFRSDHHLEVEYSDDQMNGENLISQSAPIILSDIRRKSEDNEEVISHEEDDVDDKLEPKNQEEEASQDQKDDEDCDSNESDHKSNSTDSCPYDLTQVIETQAQATSVIEHDSAIEVEKGATVKYFPNTESNGWVFGKVKDTDKSGWFPKYCVEEEKSSDNYDSKKGQS
ncbi:MAG: hypothetical protein MHMPM18_003510 [Marteilia pararefringens]